ncbi:MAG: hypothetical protein H7831_14865, partial [Magnetococcus sp. WYHC-3]
PGGVLGPGALEAMAERAILPLSDPTCMVGAEGERAARFVLQVAGRMRAVVDSLGDCPCPGVRREVDLLARESGLG